MNRGTSAVCWKAKKEVHSVTVMHGEEGNAPNLLH
jgi:hypothetical protein